MPIPGITSSQIDIPVTSATFSTISLTGITSTVKELVSTVGWFRGYPYVANSSTDGNGGLIMGTGTLINSTGWSKIGPTSADWSWAMTIGDKGVVGRGAFYIKSPSATAASVLPDTRAMDNEAAFSPSTSYFATTKGANGEYNRFDWSGADPVWISKPDTGAQNWKTIQFNSTTGLIAGGGGLMTALSTIGVAGTSTTSSFGSTGINKVKWSENAGYWLAVGEVGKAAYSTDSTNWTQKTISSGLTDSLRGITFHRGRWYVLSEFGNIWKSDTSDPSGTWTGVITGETVSKGARSIESDERFIMLLADAYVAGTPQIKWSR